MVVATRVLRAHWCEACCWTLAGSDADHLDAEQKNSIITDVEAEALKVLDGMKKTEKKVVLAELDDLQAALDRMDAAVKSEAAQDTISSSNRLFLQVSPDGNMTVTQCVSLPDRDPKLLEARKAMPNTVKVSEEEHRATLQRSATPFRGLLPTDEPLRKTLADHFTKVC